MQNILVTGGAGFIGSNFIQYLLKREDNVRLVNLDLLTYAGNLRNLQEVERDSRYSFVKGDIRDKKLVEDLICGFGIDTIVNFAAETHVDRSISGPEVFLTTNVLGTGVLLEAATRLWKLKPDDPGSRAFRDGVRFLQISTDEVYGSLGDRGSFTEESPISPSSPYAASKAGADMLARAYNRTYGLPVNITRCSNNFGPRQHPEKMIPRIILNAASDKPIPIYGDGKQVRDWLYVEDHCEAIRLVLKKGTIGEIYNIGGGTELQNLDLTKRILNIMGKPEARLAFVRDRPGHDRRYAIDSSKIRRELGWKTGSDFDNLLGETVKWYLDNEGALGSLLDDRLEEWLFDGSPTKERDE